MSPHSPFRALMKGLPANYTAMDVYRALLASDLPRDQTLPNFKRLGSPTRRRLQVGHRDGWKCSKCGAHCDIEQGTIDHHVPRSRGGSNRLTNLRWMCKTCNTAKGAEMPKTGVVSACFKKPIPVVTLVRKPVVKPYGDLFDWS